MIEPRKVKERKIYLESKYSKPTQNLYILERGARNGYITNLEDYVNEWYKYNKDNIISLVKVLDIIKYSKYYKICFTFNSKSYYICTQNKNLINYIIQIKTPCYLYC